MLLDEHEQPITNAEVSLASIDVSDGTWQGYVHGVDAELLDGREITVALPGGTKGHAQVIVDLTGQSPVIRLKGVGPGLL